jgi:hypothetical protein
MLVLLNLIMITFMSCATVYKNQNPTGQKFPSVSGESLDKQSFKIPEDFKDSIVLFLIGYKQNSQFDIDRWLIGLDMTKTKVDIYELPTIKGLFPRVIKSSINNGMRSGIPEEIWKNVITIYKDGATIQKFTGNENGLNARVILLNEKGVVSYFYDRGFAVPALNQLRENIKKFE